MAYSKVVVVGDGATKVFAVNFAMDYLLETDVTCRVGLEIDGSGNPAYRTINFIDTNLFEVGGAAPGNGVNVVFERTVDKTLLRVDFTNGDIMDDANLDTAQRHMFMAIHELLDGRTGQAAVDTDFGSYRLINVGTPVTPTDGANKAYVDFRDSLIAGFTAADRVQTGLDVQSTAAAAASVAAMFDLFDDRWLGSKTTNPTLDNDGNALLVGALYWNSPGNELRVYSGSVWVAYNPSVGIQDLVDDATPQLGGNLDLNGHVINGLLKSHVGLGNVDNTADTAKPVSTAQATSIATKSDNTRPINAQTVQPYTFVLSDAGKLVTFVNGATNYIATIPTNAVTPFPIGTQIDLAQLGAGPGQVFLQGTGVTISSELNKKKLWRQYSCATLIKIATDTWILTGSLA